MNRKGFSQAIELNRSHEDLINLRDMTIVTKFVGSFLAVGFLSLLGYSIVVAGWESFAPLLWALALGVAGMGIGFLFGIPKVLQGSAPPQSQPQPPDPTPAVASAQSPQPAAQDYRQRVNTNLEEISDWLTKIIVGLGLIQLKELPRQLDLLSRRISTSFDGTESYRAVATALIVFFVVIGFLYGYLMTRLYLQGALARAENELGGPRALRELDQKVNAALNAAAAETKRRQQARTAVSMEIDDDAWNSDPHAGFAEGKSEANGRKLTAEITPVHGAGAVNRVHLRVSTTEPKRPITSNVIFYLHPSFEPTRVEVAPDSDGVARLDILAAGVFTVGAETDNGATKLELNLEKVPGGSSEFYQN